MSENSYFDEDISGKKIRDLEAFLYLLSYGRKWTLGFVISFAAVFGSGAAAMLAAYYLGQFVEFGLKNGDANALLNFGLAVLLLELSTVLLNYFGRRGLAYFASFSILEIRKALFKHLQLLPMSYFDKQPQGRTVTRLTHDVEDIEEFFTNTSGRLLNSVVLIAAAIIAMLLTDASLGALVIVGMIPALTLTIATRFRSRVLQRDMASTNSAINARLAEYINGLPVIRNFGLEDWSKKQFQARVIDYLETCIATNRYYCFLRPTADVLTSVPLVILLFVGAPAVIENELTLATLVAFIRYCMRFAMPVQDLSRELHQVQRSFALVERVSQLLRSKTETQVLGEDGALSASGLKGDVEFKKISMSYDGKKDVLSDLSFSCRSGELIGLLGETGSGKTTTVSLLARLYEFQKGELLLDGKSVRDFERASLRQQIGFVSQDVIIFRGTLRDNLRGDNEHDDLKISSAMQATGLAAVLSRAGMNLDSEILDRGANLSVGERQLIAITRVFLESPRFLILDEATANIDPDLEETIHGAVESLMQDKTCFIIAHRLSTLRNCTKLLVFKQGKIVAQGDHQALLESSEYYRSLLEKAFSEEDTHQRTAC